MGAAYEAFVEFMEKVAPEKYPVTPLQRADKRSPILLWRLGLGPVVGRVLYLLTVTGRSTGQPRRTPVTPHVVGERTYLWCPYGGRAQWYRNLTVNPVATVQSHRGVEVVRAVPFDDDDEALAVIEELRRFDAPWLRRYLAEQGVSDTPADITRNRDRLHIRRLDATSEAGPPALTPDLVWAWLVPMTLVACYLSRRLYLHLHRRDRHR